MRAFITFEGIEGSGKTTQIQLLSERLDQRQIEHVLTREPGGTEIGNQIRSILLNPVNRDLTALSELLLYQAARAQHLARIIFPALAEGKLVLCDRYKDATRAYQGRGRELPSELLEQLNGLDILALEPDLTLLFDLDPAVAVARARIREQDRLPEEARFEQEGLEFHKRVREGYLDLASTYPQRIRIVEASGRRDEVQARVLSVISSVFPALVPGP
ncbi:MAG TPA: dTMP kinase [Candidatus Polarisedimenticolia bacterium]|nr:dTMP kinase [Candidatus Polarisedimenticolia bacterium]